MSDRGPRPPTCPGGGLRAPGPPSPGLGPSQPAGGAEPVPRDKPGFFCSGPQPSPEERPFSRAVKDSLSP